MSEWEDGPDTDDSRPPFIAVTDYDRRVLRGLQLARVSSERRYVWVDAEDRIIVSWYRPPGVVCTVCTPGGVAVNISADADESLIPEG